MEAVTHWTHHLSFEPKFLTWSWNSISYLPGSSEDKLYKSQNIQQSAWHVSETRWIRVTVAVAASVTAVAMAFLELGAKGSMQILRLVPRLPRQSPERQARALASYVVKISLNFQQHMLLTKYFLCTTFWKTKRTNAIINICFYAKKKKNHFRKNWVAQAELFSPYNMKSRLLIMSSFFFVMILIWVLIYA